MLVKQLVQSYEQADKPCHSSPTTPLSSNNQRFALRVDTQETPANRASLVQGDSLHADVSTLTVKISAKSSSPLSPDSTSTFGPQCTIITRKPAQGPAVVLSPSLPIPPDSAVSNTNKRAARYSRDEKALAAAATPPLPEFSAHQLKTFELARAAGLLAARAEAAKKRLDEVRAALADSNVPPETYRALQHERWREERWVIAAEEERKRAEEAAAAALGSISGSGPDAATSSPEPDGASFADVRREVNLATFFARSPTQVVERGRRHAAVPFPPPRSINARTAEPLQLRDWPVGAELQKMHKASSRPQSLDGKLATSASALARFGHGSSRRRNTLPPLQVSSEITVNSATDDWVHSAPPGAMSTPFPRIKIQLADDDDDDEEEEEEVCSGLYAKRVGSATIFHLAAPRPREEILADLRESPEISDVPMPAYVSSLLNQLDVNTLNEKAAAHLSPTLLSSPTITFAHSDLSSDSLHSAVFVSRPSVDSYHYPTDALRAQTLPRPAGRRFPLPFRRDARIHTPADTHAAAAPTTKPPPQDCNAPKDTSSRLAIPTFFRQRRRSATAPSDAAESNGGVMSKVRRRVASFGRW